MLADISGHTSFLDNVRVTHQEEEFADGQIPDVKVAHRLLKNSASDHIGSAAYALFTQSAIDALQVPLADAVPFTEPINGMQPIGVRVVPLHG